MSIIISLFVLIIMLGLIYRRSSISVWLIAIFILLMCTTFLVPGGAVTKSIFWCVWLAMLPLGIPLLRRLLSARLLHWYRKAMPHMSSTEEEALNAGTVWWDRDLFSGVPNWEKLLSLKPVQLTQEEQSFLDNEVNTLCSMIDDWEVTEKHRDLPEQVWAYMREKGFFGLIVPKHYGGKEFSAYAHGLIATRVFSCGITSGTTVTVPNSLGPAELLLHYGTDEQKKYYLPRLARGEEMPCFALTSPDAGSDAASMPDTGIVCHGEFEGKETLGIRLNWNKRYITFAPVATLLGLAFKLFDPENLLGDQEELGITCALIPTNTKGITIGRRHLPMNAVFQNGPTQGKDVFIPLDWIIGGKAMAGQGWRMLMECLSAGRAISLPSSGVAGVQLSAFATGAYARIRRQFNLPIGAFEGVEELLAQIAGKAYQASAASHVTWQALDRGEKPSVLSGIIKYHVTEFSRECLKHAVDIHGGKAICMGPSNYLARAYQGSPIGITVEGANILTRNMIIFGQGAIRCHPYVLKELQAAKYTDQKKAISEFDKALFGHLGFYLSNTIRSLVLACTKGRFVFAPTHPLKRYMQFITRFSASFAWLSDTMMMLLGSSLKRKERLSARLGDVLSYLYMASTVIKMFEDTGNPKEDKPLAVWALNDLCWKIETAMIDVCDNFPNRMIGILLRCIVMPIGKTFKKPNDQSDHAIAQLILNPCATRHRLTQNIYVGDRNHNMGLLKETLSAVIEIEPIEKKIHEAKKAGKISAYHYKALVEEALKTHVITDAEYKRWQEVEALRQKVIRVDDFEN